MKMHKIIIQNKEDEHTHKGGGEGEREKVSSCFFGVKKKKLSLQSLGNKYHGKYIWGCR